MGPKLILEIFVLGESVLGKFLRGKGQVFCRPFPSGVVFHFLRACQQGSADQSTKKTSLFSWCESGLLRPKPCWADFRADLLVLTHPGDLSYCSLRFATSPAAALSLAVWPVPSTGVLPHSWLCMLTGSLVFFIFDLGCPAAARHTADPKGSTWKRFCNLAAEDPADKQPLLSNTDLALALLRPLESSLFIQSTE